MTRDEKIQLTRDVYKAVEPLFSRHNLCYALVALDAELKPIDVMTNVDLAHDIDPHTSIAMLFEEAAVLILNTNDRTPIEVE